MAHRSSRNSLSYGRARSASSLARLLAVLLTATLASGLGACQGSAQAQNEREHNLASRSGGVPLEGSANRVGVPTTGVVQAFGAAASAAQAGDDEEPKDYWAAISFDRSNFDEVRKFVKDRYIEARIDETLAWAEAAAFAVASDEDRTLLLLPESFYLARKDHPDEKGKLQGKVVKISPEDRFVLLEEVDKEGEEESNKRLSDDEIRELRDKQKERRRQLDEAWRAARFGPKDFERLMDWTSRELGKGKDSKWSMKRAWVAAAQGYLYSLDPHSSLIPKSAWDDSTKEVQDSSFEGIGAILTRRPDSEYTIVESPIEGQPAVAAGLRAGDMILKVDGKDIKGEILSKVVSRIRGKGGTVVTLTVQREGEPEPMDIAIKRGRIEVKNVKYDLVPNHEDIGYIKLTGFVPHSETDIVRAYEELKKKTKGKRLKGLILDLRNNSGGLLKEGINIADRFVHNGVIVSVKSRAGTGEEETYRAKPEGTWDVPLVVLVNDGSASASEIVASAIQENGRGLVLGDRTFGKASVQTLFTPLLRDDYYIKLTVARYYSPLGRTLQVVGVNPDLVVPPDVDGKMPLGFREENLSHHLPPLNPDLPTPNDAIVKAVEACAQQQGRARKLHAADPNPAIKFDFQKMYAADLLQCMPADGYGTAQR